MLFRSLVIACAVRLPAGIGAGIVALAGVFHGLAHGAEMPLQADSIRFLAGMVLGTALLHATGVAAGLAASRRSASLVRWAGAGVVAGGLALILT